PNAFIRAVVRLAKSTVGRAGRPAGAAGPRRSSGHFGAAGRRAEYLAPQTGTALSGGRTPPERTGARLGAAGTGTYRTGRWREGRLPSGPSIRGRAGERENAESARYRVFDREVFRTEAVRSEKPSPAAAPRGG